MPEQTDFFPATRIDNEVDSRLARVPLHEILTERIDVRPPDSLRQSIFSRGVLVPVILGENDTPELNGDLGQYYIIDGRRRVTVANWYGHDTIPAVIVRGNNLRASSIGLAVNLVRSRNHVTELQAIEHLLLNVRGSTAHTIANHLDVSVSTVRNRMRLIPLEMSWRGYLASGRISLRTAVRLAELSPQVREEFREVMLFGGPDFRLTTRVIDEHLGIGQVEQTDLPMLPDDIEPEAVGWDVAVAICDRLIQSVPDPSHTPDPSHVEDIIYRLNTVAELLHAMEG